MVLGSPRRPRAARRTSIAGGARAVAGRLVADGAAERAAAAAGPQRVRVAAKTAPAEERRPTTCSTSRTSAPGRRARSPSGSSTDFIFSESLTAQQLEEELDDLGRRTETKTVRRAQTTVTFVGAGALIYAGINFLKGFQAWCSSSSSATSRRRSRCAPPPPACNTAPPAHPPRRRRRPLAEPPPPPPQLTGQYISYDASDVEYVIDAATGKNMTVAGSKADKSKEDDVEKPPPPPPPKWMPGFIANAKAADDADFFEAAKRGSRSSARASTRTAAAAPAPCLDGDDDEADDDSGDLDDLDDLLG